MGLRKRNPLDLYRASPEVTPSARIDAFVLAAARAARAPARRRLEWFLAGAAVASVAAVFFVRVASTPSQDFAGKDFGLNEGQTHTWLTSFDLQQPTGPGSQEGLP